MLITKRQGYAMIIPSSLEVGDLLQCNTIRDEVKNLIGSSAKFTTAYSDFKVVGEEQINTPAGTFDCLKLEGRTSEKLSGMGGYSYNAYCQWWIARGVGLVKYELYEDTEKGRKKTPFVIYLNKLDLK